MVDLVISPPFSIMDIDIAWDADWYDGFQILEDDETPVDLTGKSLELYVRPAFQHATLIKRLLSSGSAGQRIEIDGATEGMAIFDVARANVQSFFPEPLPGAYRELEQFLLLKDGGAYTEIWRGPFRIHPGNTATS